VSCIILNMVHMAMDYDDAPYYYSHPVELVNYLFTAVFIAECILKLIAFGEAYFATSWNCFDFSVVVTSMFEITLDGLGSANLRFLRLGPQLAKVLRVLRVGRLIRLINRYRGIDALLQTIWFSLPSLFNVFALLMLIYFISAVLGTFLFRRITTGYIISDQFNFSNFGMSLVLVIRMSTGEDWNYVMQDTMNTDPTCIQGKTCGIAYAPIFFVPFMMLCTFIMLNLFILVIIQ
jgi:Ion transport protein